MSPRIAIYGSDGFGREVLPLVRSCSAGQADIVFVDDDVTKQGARVNGVLVQSFSEAVHDQRDFCLAIANSQVRQSLAQRIANAGLVCRTIRAKSVISYDNVTIGEGAILCEHVTITSDVRIGRHFHANIYSYVAHDCLIGDYVTFAPRVSCNGRVRVEDGAYIGTGAVLRQGSHEEPLVIGAGATVGMGAVVTKSVAPGAVVIGNPARAMRVGD